MTLRQIALLTDTNRISDAELSAVAAALQTQVLRDFAPAWGVSATVDAFPSLDDVPVTYWPMIVKDDIEVNAAGIHLDKNFTPYALIAHSNRWSLTASHEALEMLGDPFGNRLEPGLSLKDDQGLVEYLVEVCDPSEAVGFSYVINGVVVSDFYLPSFFDPVSNERVRYSFTGAVGSPRQVREGGYLSWRNPVDNHWWQQIWFGTPAATFRDLGTFDASMSPLSVRDWLDGQVLAERPEAVEGVTEDANPQDHESLMAAFGVGVTRTEASAARAARLRDEIEGFTR